MLKLIDGTRTLGDIRTAVTGHGIKPDAFDKAWRATFTALERVNRLLLAAPAG
jgi:hypothetical protein